MDPVPSSSGQRPATIRDVARHAGVGVATVSRVLNESPLVSEETRSRVHRAIEELGFRRSSTARRLSLGRSHAVGVVAPFFTTPSVVERLRGVVEQLSERGYDVMIFDVETQAQRAGAFRDFARRDRMDGVLVISLPVTPEEVWGLRRDRMPVVLLDVDHPDLPHVVIDDVRGGELAGEHLLAMGHRRIGFVGDEAPSPFGFASSERRRRGLRNALGRAGIDAGHLERRGPYGRDEARALAADLLRGAERPTAIFAASDMQAIGVLEAAESLGLEVPGDVAVIGFDDIEMAAVLGLTTVRQPLRSSGTCAAGLLLAAIEGTPMPAAGLEPLAVIRRRTA
jgi:DNA-binding LacI/PurR family transcriptional regulator